MNTLITEATKLEPSTATSQRFELPEANGRRSPLFESLLRAVAEMQTPIMQRARRIFVARMGHASFAEALQDARDEAAGLFTVCESIKPLTKAEEAREVIRLCREQNRAA